MICSMFPALVTCIKFIKRTNSAPGFINPFTLRGDHGQVSATRGVEVLGLRVSEGDAADIERTGNGKCIFCYENIFLYG